MAQESLDLYMTIKRADGTSLKGETTDAAFGSNPRPETDDDDGEPHFAIELNSFDMSFEEAGFKKDEKKEKKKDKADAKGAKASTGGDLKKTPQQTAEDKVRQRTEALNGLMDQLRNFQDGRIVVTRTFRVKKGLDTASPGLYLAYCEGMPKSKRTGPQPDTKFDAVAVMARKAGSTEKPFLVVTFGAVKVGSYALSMDGLVPVENVGFEFETVQIEYASQDASGELGEYSTATGTFQMAAEDES